MEKPIRRFSQGSPIVSSYIRDLISKDVRRKDDVENNLPYLETLSKFSLVVPIDSRFSFLGNIEDDPFITDKRTRSALEDSKIINWCPGIKRFIPLSISNDGNSLCHSLSVALWGVHDRSLSLRHLVSVAMKSEQREQFKNRWMIETERRIAGKLQDEEGNSVWDSEWEVQVQLANEVNRSVRMNNPMYDPLEDFHIFVLANILRRPIIVLADKPITGVVEMASPGGGFSSIYLPLLWATSECNRSPILLGFCENYFSPLVIFSNVDGTDLCPEVIPLAHEDHTPIEIRYVTAEEASYRQQLLKDYLCVVEIEATKSGQFTYIISAAKLMPKPLEETQKMLLEFLAIRSAKAPEQTAPHDIKSEWVPPPATTAQRRTSRFRCGNKTCSSFITNDSTFPYCSECYKNNENRAAPARRKVNSRAGITPPVSLEVDCSTAGCPYFASVNSFPYCQRCHLRRTSEQQRSQKSLQSPGTLASRMELSLEDKWLKLAMGIIDEEVVSGISSDKKGIDELVDTFHKPPEQDEYMFANKHRIAPLEENEEIAMGGVTSTRSLTQEEPRRRTSSVSGVRSIPIRKLSIDEQNPREDWQRKVSWVNEPCQKMGCPYFASLRTFPYCNQCSSEVQVLGVAPPRRKISGTARILPVFPQED